MTEAVASPPRATGFRAFLVVWAGQLDPWMAPGGALAGSAGRVLGVGEGRGIGLLFVAIGLAMTLLAVGGYLQPRIRGIEDELPDAIPDVPEPA